MADNVYITSSDGISAAGGLSAGKTSYFSGNVGIGTNTPHVNTKLTVQRSDDQIRVTDGSLAYDIGYDNSYYRLKNSAGDTHFVTNWSTGKVGIGADEPGSKLTVQGQLSTSDNANIGGFLYATCGRFSNDVCIGGNELWFPNDAASAYIKGADDLFIQADYDGDDTNKAIYLDTGGSRRANINQHGLSGSGGLSGHDGYFAGNVGIGISSPSSSLHICATDPRVRVDATTGNHPGYELLESGSRCWVMYNDPDNSDALTFKSDVDRFVIKDSGNVGIGCTAPTCKLEVGGNALVVGNTTITGNLSVTGDITCLDTAISLTSALSVVNAGTGPALYVEQDGAQPIAHFIDKNGDDIVFDDNGKVGIGTSSPGEKLTVQGNISANGDIKLINPTPWIRLQTSDASEKRLDLCVDSNSVGVIAANQSAQELAFCTTGGERMRIDASGCMGIGCTDPIYKLDVAGDIQAKDSAVIAGLGASDGYIFHDFGTGWGYKGVTGPSRLGIFTDTAERITIGSSGKVGIGTTSPEEKLTVQGNISACGNICTNCCQVYGHQVRAKSCLIATKLDAQYCSNAGEVCITSGCQGCVRIGTHDAFAMTLSANNCGVAQVGIGNSSPGKSLDICSGTGDDGIRLCSTGSGGRTVAELQIDNVTNGNADFRLYCATNITTRITTNASNPTYFNAGDVGIGTTTPNEKLTVAGNISASGDVCIGDDLVVNGESITICGPSAQLKFCDTTDTDDMYMTFANAGTTYGCVGYLGATDFDICTNNRDISLLPGTANVGINTTAPNETLTVVGDISATECFRFPGGLYLKQGSNSSLQVTNDNGYLQIGPQNSSWSHFYTDRANYYFNTCLVVDGGGVQSYNEDLVLAGNYTGTACDVIIKTDNTDRIHVEAAGNVGIGTALPGAKLTVQGTVSADGSLSAHNGIVITKPGTTGKACLELKGKGNSTGDQVGIVQFKSYSGAVPLASMQGIRHDDDVIGCLAFSTSNSERVRIDNNGKVGIGTSSPGDKLTVQGTVSASGDSISRDSYIDGGIYRSGDTDTRILFTDDDINITVGGINMVDFTEGGTDEITFNESAQQLDVRIEGEADANLFFTDAVQNRVGIGTNSPGAKLTVQGTVSASGIKVPDESKINIGTGNDLQLQHSGGSSYIENSTGHLYINNNEADKDIFFRNDNGSGTATTYFFLDGSAVDTRVCKNFRFIDNVKAGFGTSMNLNICNDGTHSYIANGANSLYVRTASTIQLENSDGSEDMATFAANGAVSLYYDNVKKFETTSAGATVQGTVSSSGLTVPDNSCIDIGTGDDLQLYHNGTDSYIDSGASAGDLYIRNNSNNTVVIGHNANKGLMYVPDGRVELRFNDSAKLCTTNTGINVAGGATINGDISGSGSVTAACFVKTGGSSSQFLKADGSVDSNAYTTCTGTTTNSNTQTFTNKSGNISQWTNDCCYLTSACCGTVTCVATGDGLTGGAITSSGTLCVDSTVIRTTGDQSIAGTKTFTCQVDLCSCVCANFGDSQELNIYHSGTSSFIDNNKNHLNIRTNVDGDDGGNIYLMPHDNETGILINDDSTVVLYNNNSVKFCTCSSGSRTTGTHYASTRLCSPAVCGTSSVCSPTVCGTSCGSFCTLYLTNLPTSSCCLCAGAVYNDGGYLKIVSGCGCGC